jgi:hypothetical protein
MKTFTINNMKIRVVRCGYGQYVAQNQDGLSLYTTNSRAYDGCDDEDIPQRGINDPLSKHEESQLYFFELLNNWNK